MNTTFDVGDFIIGFAIGLIYIPFVVGVWLEAFKAFRAVGEVVTLRGRVGKLGLPGCIILSTVMALAAPYYVGRDVGKSL